MTTEKAIWRCESLLSDFAAGWKDCDMTYVGGLDARAIRVVLDALAEARRERDRLVERWPTSGDESGTVYRIGDGPYAGRWLVPGRSGDHPTKEAAVRAAAGLDAEGATDA